MAYLAIFEMMLIYMIGIIRLDNSKIFLLVLNLILSIGQVLAQPNSDQSSLWLKKAIELRFTAPDSAHQLFEKSFRQYLYSGDTLGAIDALVKRAKLYAHNANFSNSYDAYWQALFLAEEVQSTSAKSLVYNGLGWMYSFYYKNDEAVNYFNKSLEILKSNNGSNAELGREYYALLTLYRKQRRTDYMKAYLDSCLMLKRDQDKWSGMFIEAEKGYLKLLQKEPERALQILLPLRATFENRQHSYLVILSSYIAQAYELLGKNKLALEHYNNALSVGTLYNSHQDLIPDILVQKSKLNLKMGNNSEAFESMEMAKVMNDSLFGSRSDLNRSLLEIKDEFRLEKERQARVENQKRIEALEQEERLFQLRMTISYVTILFLAIVGAIYYRYLKSKHRNEKVLLTEKQRIEIEKANEVLELKNKELTASALQILKRDETINQIKKQIADQKNNPDGSKLNSIVNTINLSQADDWKQFESRFLSVNQDFYSKLKSQFPKLSPADHKICALIKLGFDSVDMAKLLGIAVESVHTTRYRLRKKMNLTRQDNLEELIIGIG